LVGSSSTRTTIDDLGPVHQVIPFSSTTNVSSVT